VKIYRRSCFIDSNKRNIQNISYIIAIGGGVMSEVAKSFNNLSATIILYVPKVMDNQNSHLHFFHLAQLSLRPPLREPPKVMDKMRR